MKDPQLEIIRLKRIIIELETKNNLLLLKHNLVQRLYEKIDGLENKITSFRTANWELTIALDEAKERLEQQEELVNMVLYKPVHETRERITT